MDRFLPVLSALNDAGVRYVVVGGLAVVLHGHVRFTADLDIVIHLERRNVVVALEVLRALGLRPTVPVRAEDFADEPTREGWIETKGMKVLGLSDPDDPYGVHVDVFVREPFPFAKLREDSVTAALGDQMVPIASIPHLIVMKADTGRMKDAEDVRVLRILRDELDR